MYVKSQRQLSSFSAGITFFIRLAPGRIMFQDHKHGMLATGIVKKRVTEISTTNNNVYFNRNADFSARSR
jgi:hypothetical protein